MPGNEGLGGGLGNVRVDLRCRAGNVDLNRGGLLAHQPACHTLDPHRHVALAEDVFHGAERAVAAPGQTAGIEADLDLAQLALAVADDARAGQRLPSALAGLDLADQRGDAVGGLWAEDVVPAPYDRRQGAATDAEDLFDGELPGGVGIVGALILK